MFAFHKIFFIRTKQKFNFWTPAERKQLTSKIFCCYCCCKRSAAPTTQQQFAAAVNSTKRAEEFSNYQPENISKSELSTLKEIRKSWMAIKTENNTHKKKKAASSALFAWPFLLFRIFRHRRRTLRAIQMRRNTPWVPRGDVLFLFITWFSWNQFRQN